MRYSVWLIAPLWYCLFRYLPERFSLRPRGWLLGAALCMSVCLILYLRTYELFWKDIRRFGGGWRARPEIAALMRILPYSGDAEVLVENIMGEELRHSSLFRDVYMWDLGHDHHLWVLPERALSLNRPLIWETKVPEGISVTIEPRQPFKLIVEGNSVSVKLPEPPLRMYRHPVLGNYLVLRSRGRITRILNNQDIKIRSDTIEQVDSLAEQP